MVLGMSPVGGPVAGPCAIRGTVEPIVFLISRSARCQKSITARGRKEAGYQNRQGEDTVDGYLLHERALSEVPFRVSILPLVRERPSVDCLGSRGGRAELVIGQDLVEKALESFLGHLAIRVDLQGLQIPGDGGPSLVTLGVLEFLGVL